MADQDPEPAKRSRKRRNVIGRSSVPATKSTRTKMAKTEIKGPL